MHASVVTTEQIASTVRLGKEQRANHAVLNAAPLEGGVQDLLIDPYVLGAWLGDGHSAGNRITCETDEIPMYIEGAGYRVQTQGEMLYSIRLHEDDALEATRGICVDCGGTCFGARRCAGCHAEHSFTAQLRRLRVLGDKHIPTAYLRASESSRRALLAGLMDTDGTVVRGVGSCQFAVTNERLAQDVYELVVSLGYRCGRRTKRVQGRSEASSTCYILNFSTTDDVFRLERKHLLHKEERPTSTTRIGRRYITSVTPGALGARQVRAGRQRGPPLPRR